jgi:hypothetical protein
MVASVLDAPVLPGEGIEVGSRCVKTALRTANKEGREMRKGLFRTAIVLGAVGAAWANYPQDAVGVLPSGIRTFRVVG